MYYVNVNKNLSSKHRELGSFGLVRITVVVFKTWLTDRRAVVSQTARLSKSFPEELVPKPEMQ